MKKSVKLTLIILAVLTVVCVIASITMLTAVANDTLFYMNSWLGYIYAVSYRWVCLASVVLLLFWILLAVKKRGVIASRFAKSTPEVANESTQEATIETAPEEKEKLGGKDSGLDYYNAANEVSIK